MALEIAKDEIINITDKITPSPAAITDGTNEISTTKNDENHTINDKSSSTELQIQKKMISLCGIFTLPFSPYQLLVIFVRKYIILTGNKHKFIFAL